ncbi:MAG: energy-coupling factor ABC transporter ATP-binding protein [Chloroflexi bacterium]|nr:energy-coupling factor ABC transporter ATP-binding protein [Chloroflexota bacterium]
MSSVIDIRNLHYRYPNPKVHWVLERVNLQIAAGEYVLLCGASGSGKSTLCRTLNGLIPHFHGGLLEGQVEVAGLNVRDHPVSELFAHVGMVFQNAEAQLFNSTVRRELAFGLESLGLSRPEILRRVAEIAEIAGITRLLERIPHQLSGGEQQLVMIAAALALHPQIIVLDEPYANLDPAHVKRVRQALRNIHRQGTAILVAEHRLQHVIADAERMVVLHRGRVVLDGPVRKILAQANLPSLGLHLPPVVALGRELETVPLPLCIGELVQALGQMDLPRQLPDLTESENSISQEQGFRRQSPGAVLLQVKDLGFSIPDKQQREEILRDVDLEVNAGECLAVVGANGSGKTTLIKHFNGLYRPQRGWVRVMGLDTRRERVSRLARHVGIAFQNPNDQFFQFQVQEEIEVGARTLDRYDATWIDNLIAMFQLEPLVQRSPYRLSEGEKKRVAFAAALGARPEILVLDEPTAGQDWYFRRTLGDLINRLVTQGQTIILVTHDLEFAEMYAQQWIVLGDGRVQTRGTPQKVMTDDGLMQRSGLEATQAFQLRQVLKRVASKEKTKLHE